MAYRLTLTAVVVGLAALLAGCRDQPTAPSASDGLNPQLAMLGGNGPPQTVTFSFPSKLSAEDLIVGDGRVPPGEAPTTYTGGECGVGTLIAGYNGNAALNTRDSKISPSEKAACDGREGRYLEVSLKRLDDGYDDLPWDGQIVRAKWLNVFYDIVAIRKGDAEDRSMRIWFDDGHQGGYGWAQACPWGLGYGYGPPGNSSSFVSVERRQEQAAGDDFDEWLVKADFDDAVAVCLGGKSEPVILGYYDVPFQFTVVCEGEC